MYFQLIVNIINNPNTNMTKRNVKINIIDTATKIHRLSFFYNACRAHKFRDFTFLILL